MAQLQPVFKLITTYMVALIIGMVVSIVMLFRMIIKGPTKFFYSKEYEKRPECMKDPVYGQHGYVTLKSGIKLHTVTGGEANKPLMLFLHGFPENWYSWRYQIKEFSKDYRTCAVDMRGFGESDKPIGVCNYDLDTLSDDIKELMEGIGEKKCTLVAHDWGGIVAEVFTLKYPSMVEKLVLCNIPHVKAFQEHMETAWSQNKKSWYMILFQLPWLPEMLYKVNDYGLIEELFSSPAPVTGRKALEKPEEIDAFKFALSRDGGLTSSLNYYRAMYRFMHPKLSTWVSSVPTLMVFGIHDNAIDAETCELSRKYFVDFKLDYIEEATHWVQQMAPEKVNRCIRNFIENKKQE